MLLNHGNSADSNLFAQGPDFVELANACETGPESGLLSSEPYCRIFLDVAMLPYLVLPLAESHLTRSLFGQIVPRRTTRVASDLVERPVHGRREASSGPIRRELSLRSVVKGGKEARA